MLVWRSLCGCGVHPSCCPGAGICWDALGAGVAFVVLAFVVLAWPSSCFVRVVLSCSCCCEPCLLRWRLCWHLSCCLLAVCRAGICLAGIRRTGVRLAGIRHAGIRLAGGSSCWRSSCWHLSCWRRRAGVRRASRWRSCRCRHVGIRRAGVHRVHRGGRSSWSFVVAVVRRGGGRSLWLHSSWWRCGGGSSWCCHVRVIVDLFIWRVVVAPITISTTVK